MILHMSYTTINKDYYYYYCQEDFRWPEKKLDKTREIDNEARISKKAEMKRKLNRNQKRITLWSIQLSFLTSLNLVMIINKYNEIKSTKDSLFQ